MALAKQAAGSGTGGTGEVQPNYPTVQPVVVQDTSTPYVTAALVTVALFALVSFLPKRF